MINIELKIDLDKKREELNSPDFNPLFDRYRDFFRILEEIPYKTEFYTTIYSFIYEKSKDHVVKIDIDKDISIYIDENILLEIYIDGTLPGNRHFTRHTNHPLYEELDERCKKKVSSF